MSFSVTSDGKCVSQNVEYQTYDEDEDADNSSYYNIDGDVSSMHAGNITVNANNYEGLYATTDEIASESSMNFSTNSTMTNIYDFVEDYESLQLPDQW